MTEASIPVDLFNPGQVFACLGFLEAAELLLGDAEGGFEWSDPANVRYFLRAAGEENSFAAVLEFLATAEITDVEPNIWPATSSVSSTRMDTFPTSLESFWDKQNKKWTRTALPIHPNRKISP